MLNGRAKKIAVRTALISIVALGISCFESCRTIAEPPVEARRETLAVVGADGREHERAVAAIAAGDEKKSLLQHHLRYLLRQPGPPLIANNDVKLLIDGPQTYDAMFSELAQARRTIDIEAYIFADDRIGHALAELMKNKSRDGLRVRLIYDSVGCIKTPRAFFNDMRDAGVQIVEFNPVNPLAGKLFDLNNRDHRKIVIADDRVAFTGGINISSVYTHGSGFSRKSGRAADETRRADEDEALTDGWRDTQIQIRGPGAQALGDLFEAMWRSDGGNSTNALRADTDTNEASVAAGDKYVRVIGSSPDDRINFIYSDLLNAIDHAQRSIHVTMSYFSPNPRMIHALQRAAQRHVDVQLVLPGFSDWWPVLEAGRSHYAELLDAGVQIYERKDVFLHAKTAVIDGVWSTVGSSNMDMRSFLHNSEVNVVVLGNDFGEAMESMFAADRDKAEGIDEQQWRDRPLPLRCKQVIARMFSYWL